MARFALIGDQYESQSPLADAQRTINWYREDMENPGSRVQSALYPTPGLDLFVNLGNFPTGVRGSITVNGRSFKIAGPHLFEIFGNRTATDRGSNPATPNCNIVDDGTTAYLVAGGTSGGTYPAQLLIASGGTLSVFNIATNTWQAISATLGNVIPANVVDVDFLDGFFIALSSTNVFYVSNPEDASTWNGLAASQISVFSDALLSMIVDHRLCWIFGGKRAVAYQTIGTSPFPLGVVTGSFMERGIIAGASLVRIADSIFWLSADERGGGVVVRGAGFTPQRVSDHAFEFAISQYSTINDAVAYPYQDQGHNFYVLWFPTADKTWVLDVDLLRWHQRSSLIAGVPHAHLSRCHTFNFGLHLVGDRQSGNVYSMSIFNLTDNGQPIIRTRRGAEISIEAEWMFFHQIQFDVEPGLGPMPPFLDGRGFPRGPQMMFSYSKDHAKTWSNEEMLDCGQTGQYRFRVIRRRLGKGRSFLPQITVSDPIPWRIVDAYVLADSASGEMKAQKRLSKAYGELS